MGIGIYLLSLGGIIIIWRYRQNKDGTLIDVQLHKTYSTNLESYVKTAKELYQNNDDAQIWIDKSSEGFEIKVEKPEIDDVYLSEEYNGDLEIDSDLIKL